MRKKIAALITALMACTGVGLVATATPAAALGKVKCDLNKNGNEQPSGTNVSTARTAIDPIVNHNGVGASHVHDFFGASWDSAGVHWTATVGNNANYTDLTSTKSSCRIAADTAGYWTPALKYISGPNAGQYVPVLQFTAYYRGFNSQTTHAGSQALPADVRLVAQDMIGKGLSGWTCGQNSTVTGGQNSIPDCSGEDGTPGNTLTAHISYPSCWDGVLPNHSAGETGDTRDNAHFTYPANSATQCPAAFPIETTQLRQTVQYKYTGNGTDVALTSDIAGGDGTTMHGDFWNTWNQAVFVGFIRKCVQGLSATTYTGSCDV